MHKFLLLIGQLFILKLVLAMALVSVGGGLALRNYGVFGGIVLVLMGGSLFILAVIAALYNDSLRFPEVK